MVLPAVTGAAQQPGEGWHARVQRKVQGRRFRKVPPSVFRIRRPSEAAVPAAGVSHYPGTPGHGVPPMDTPCGIRADDAGSRLPSTAPADIVRAGFPGSTQFEVTLIMSDVGGIAADRLKSFVERIERLEEEKRGLQEDIKEVYSEAKGTGFDTKIIRQIIRLRKMDKADRQEQEAILELYKEALGMVE